MRIVMGSDHGGLDLKTAIAQVLTDAGHEVIDLGTHDTASTDYPDYAERVAKAVVRGDAERGVLVCGTGQGMAIAANKVHGVRAGAVSDVFSARMIVAHNNAQIVCIGARVVGPSLAQECVDAFLAASFEGGRHSRRVGKITALEGGSL